MNKNKMKIVMMSENEVSLCPYCDGIPSVEVDIKKGNFDNDKVSKQEVTCYCCGLSAPMDVWEAIADNFEKSIVNKDDYE